MDNRGDVSESTPQPAPMTADTLRRAIAAGPVSLVIFFVTLLFTVVPASQLLQGDEGSVLVLSSFSAVVWSTVAVAVTSVLFGFTVGRRLDDATAHYPNFITAMLFGASSGGIGLVACALLMPFVELVDGVTSSEVLLALMLVIAVPALVSGFGTRWVLEASSESWGEVAVAVAVAAASVAVFFWLVHGVYVDPQESTGG